MTLMMTNLKKVFISSSNPSASHARSRGLFFFQEFSERRTFLLNKKECLSVISILSIHFIFYSTFINLSSIFFDILLFNFLLIDVLLFLYILPSNVYFYQMHILFCLFVQLLCHHHHHLLQNHLIN